MTHHPLGHPWQWLPLPIAVPVPARLHGAWYALPGAVLAASTTCIALAGLQWLRWRGSRVMQSLRDTIEYGAGNAPPTREGIDRPGSITLLLRAAGASATSAVVGFLVIAVARSAD
ncbi:hypothetical protein AB0D04_38655 [Streptomyces sp. NPDC048483]|uniref:hypothetical protein n=1 Tax=Streptomyces sp. NPDC048483 TaxID=3154927 RepID=UPI0034270B19